MLTPMPRRRHRGCASGRGHRSSRCVALRRVRGYFTPGREAHEAHKGPRSSRLSIGPTGGESAGGGSVKNVVIALALAFVGVPAAVQAQRNQPIYPAYDGYREECRRQLHDRFWLFQPQRRAGVDPARSRERLRARSRRSPAACRLQARPVAISVRHGRRRRRRGEDALDAHLCRHDHRHERADAAVELEPRRRRGRDRPHRLSPRPRAAFASIARRRCVCWARPHARAK